MLKYVFVLLLISASVCYAHESWTNGSRNRKHLSGDDLDGYAHGHSQEIRVNAGNEWKVQTSYMGYDPDFDYDPNTPGIQPPEHSWEAALQDPEFVACVDAWIAENGPLTRNGVGDLQYPTDCFRIYLQNAKPLTLDETGINLPHQHPDCFGNGEAHFHRRDEHGFWHGIDHSGLNLVGGIFTELHTHPVCKKDTPLPTGDIPGTNIHLPQHEIFYPSQRGGGGGGFPSVEIEDDGIPRCDALTGYGIEFNDENQVKLIAPNKSRHAKLYLYFDDTETTRFGVFIGYTQKSLSLEQWNTWIDIDDIQIVNFGQANAYCIPCNNYAFTDAIKMELMIPIQGLGLCPGAVYPEPVRAAPSAQRKLATTWASLKRRTNE